jgi:hypothetical protein
MSDSSARLAAALADRYRLKRELGHSGMAIVPVDAVYQLSPVADA